MKGNYKRGFEFYLSKKNKEAICPLPGAGDVMLTDSETRGASSHLRSLGRQGCLETGQSVEAQGFLGILERDGIDHMELIKGGLFFCE